MVRSWVWHDCRTSEMSGMDQDWNALEKEDQDVSLSPGRLGKLCREQVAA